MTDTTNTAALERLGISDDADLLGLVEASLDCIKIVERDGTVSFMNAHGMCSMEIEDFHHIDGKRWSDLWPADAQGLIEDAVDRALKGESVRLEAFCPTALGRPRWWDITVSPMIREGEVQRILSISRDITDRVRREQVAEERERAAIRELALAKTRLGEPVPDTAAPLIARVGQAADAKAELRETQRLDAVDSLGLSDADASPQLDGLVTLAAQLMDTPSAAVTIVGTDRQWYKASTGFEACETLRTESLCSVAIRTPEIPLVVEDTRLNPLTSGNPASESVAAYAGVPLLTTGGHAVGTLCAFGPEPRTFSLQQVTQLKTLARAVQAELERERLARRTARLDLINAELKHRMGNSYAQVSSLVGLLSQTAKSKDSLARALRENITALSRTQARIAQGGWASLDLCSLLEETVRASDPDARIDCEVSPNYDISPQAAFMLTLALQELATNSRKHGLLRKEEGRVKLHVETVDDRLVLRWEEAHGTENIESERVLPATPSSGFGQKLLTRIVPLGLGGTADLRLDGSGMSYTLGLPKARVAA